MSDLLLGIYSDWGYGLNVEVTADLASTAVTSPYVFITCRGILYLLVVVVVVVVVVLSVI